MSDAVCLLSGLSADGPGGPSRLIDHEDLEATSVTMASEILSYRQPEVSLSVEHLTSIVSNALELTLPPPEHRILYDRAPNLPDGVSDWEYWDCIGIGRFDQSLIGACSFDEQRRWSSGRDIQARLIDQYDTNGYFYGVVVNDPDAKDVSGLRSKHEASYCGTAIMLPQSNL